MNTKYVEINLEPSTADAVSQDFDSLSRAEGRMPGTNPPEIEKCSMSDHLMGKNELPDDRYKY